MIGFDPGGDVTILINRMLPEDAVHIIDGVIHTHSMSALLAQIERERRRADAIAAFRPSPWMNIKALNA